MAINTTTCVRSLSGTRWLCLSTTRLYPENGSAIGTIVVGSGDRQETKRYQFQHDASNQIAILDGGLKYDHEAGETAVLT